MGIMVEWDNPEHTVIRFIYTGQWSVDDLFSATQESRVMMDSVNHRVHGIIDMRSSKLVPNGALSLGRNVSLRKHPNQGRSIVIGANNLVRTLFDVYRKVYRTSFDETAYSFATTLEEARSQLQVTPVR